MWREQVAGVFLDRAYEDCAGSVRPRSFVTRFNGFLPLCECAFRKLLLVRFYGCGGVKMRASQRHLSQFRSRVATFEWFLRSGVRTAPREGVEGKEGEVIISGNQLLCGRSCGGLWRREEGRCSS